MPIFSFERILKIIEIICKVLVSALGAIGVYDKVVSNDSDVEAK